MLYLTGCIPSKDELRSLLRENGIGAMLTPFSQRSCPGGWPWAADNGCFASRWTEAVWFSWLRSKEDPGSALFATVPDVVGDHSGTLERWWQWHAAVADLGYSPAFVLQDGLVPSEVPWDQMGALFVGGTTDFKLSEDSRLMVAEAKRRGKWVHMGRVNSRKRIRIAHEWGCDSVDGTFLAFAPDHNTHRLIRIMAEGTSVPPAGRGPVADAAALLVEELRDPQVAVGVQEDGHVPPLGPAHPRGDGDPARVDLEQS